MRQIGEEKIDKKLYDSLKIDCEKCFGLCCVALYFSASEGFPTDKAAGKPCNHLKEDFSCYIHKELREKGLKGCMAYDCFGAGQKVAQVTYGGCDWRQNPQSAKQMYEVFLSMRQLHEMLWYLTDALIWITDTIMIDDIKRRIGETKRLTDLDGESILSLDVEAHRMGVNGLLRQAAQKAQLSSKKSLNAGYDFAGADLTKTNLLGAHFAGAVLIAANLRGADLTGANFIGSDLRDADIRGANLEKCLFLTQGQVNTAKGDAHTKLPGTLVRPSYWEK